MLTEDDIKRINELYHKRKDGSISAEELAEHDDLRARYIAAIRENLRGSLNATTIQYPDGSRVNLGEKYGNKGSKS